jgi:hypothetical protein
MTLGAARGWPRIPQCWHDGVFDVQAIAFAVCADANRVLILCAAPIGKNSQRSAVEAGHASFVERSETWGAVRPALQISVRANGLGD